MLPLDPGTSAETASEVLRDRRWRGRGGSCERSVVALSEDSHRTERGVPVADSVDGDHQRSHEGHL